MSTDTTVAAPEPAIEVSERKPSPRGAVLPPVVRTEWTKLRSVRSTMWTLAIGITFGLGMLFCFAYTRRFDRLGVRERLTFDPTAQSLRGLFLAQLAIGVLGVLVISSEYATGLIRTTLTAVPQRRVVLAAKAIVFGVIAAIVTTIAVFPAFFAG